MRPGLVQLEIGVQSTNKDTIHEIHRTMDFDKLSDSEKQDYYDYINHVNSDDDDD